MAIDTKSFVCLTKSLDIINDGFKRLAPVSIPPNHLRQVQHEILAKCYSTVVKPNINLLRKYATASDNVYGELLPTLVDDIISATNITSESLFLDLGSGVGHVVMQASLRTGCCSYGIEKASNPSNLAEKSKSQLLIRSHMWGIAVGGEIILEQGDMTQSAQVASLIEQADVVLVNNKCFLPQCSPLLNLNIGLLTFVISK